jgi:hypothetical protein
LPGGDADADPEVERRMTLVQVVHRRQYCERRPYRPLRVVLVSHRGAEHRHDTVANKLLEHAAMALDLPSKAGMVGPQ